MPYLIKPHDNLDKISNQHIALTLVFKEFAHFIKDCILAPSIANHSIAASLHLDQGFFTTTFAGRTVSFVFTSLLENEASVMLVGNVKCYIKKDFPEPKLIEFGGFTFNEKGHTNIKIPDSDATVHITNDMGTFLMALHFIHQSLSK
ncbi:conserved hypothetical protein [Crenothrix polyspora]|uniref:Uncharacterized protein n=1 Tax=Crenothrix polyspora TaxID=360316 RepID=A0A1R4H7E7_9GAMM|nr:hypothetical protein [Crenothrix polyspora]SJM92173.1 conserved hypothetical protein [Crenothrix polyspora]